MINLHIDRILCLELVAKRHARWLLHYVKDAVAETDCPSTVPEFLAQRRRWLNGTFFCQLYAIAHLGRFWQTEHSFGRKLALTFEFAYLAVLLLFNSQVGMLAGAGLLGPGARLGLVSIESMSLAHHRRNDVGLQDSLGLH